MILGIYVFLSSLIVFDAGDKEMLKKNWKKIIVGGYSLFLALIFSIMPLLNAPCANILTREHAILEIESNGDFLIFYGTLFTACIVGVIELLPQLKKATNIKKILLSILYFIFVGGICLSVSGGYGVLRENYSIISSEIIGSDLKIWSEQTTFYCFYKIIFQDFRLIGMILGFVIIISFIIIFDVLYFVLNQDHIPGSED